MYDTISIDNIDFPRPVAFAPQREDILASEYETCSGARCADRIGWRYSDLTLEWNALPQALVQKLASLSGEVYLSFDDATGHHYEKVRRNSVVAMRHRNKINGVYYWRKVSVTFKFLEAHN